MNMNSDVFYVKVTEASCGFIGEIYWGEIGDRFNGICGNLVRQKSMGCLSKFP